MQNGHRKWFKPYQNQKTESLFCCFNIKGLVKDKISNILYNELRIRSIISRYQWEEYVLKTKLKWYWISKLKPIFKDLKDFRNDMKKTNQKEEDKGEDEELVLKDEGDEQG